MREEETYRRRFLDPEEAKAYAESVYEPGSVSDLLWQVEKPLLSDIVEAQHRRVGNVQYLDFACGTGRVLNFLEPLVSSATGVDVSRSMLRLAAERTTTANLICTDITTESGKINDRFDLITAFRFFTNAERSLRRAALAELAQLLRSEHSLLILNIHANLWSYRSLSIPYYWLREEVRGVPRQFLLSQRTMAREISEAGLWVEAVIGLGFIPGHLVSFLPFNVALSIERFLAETPLVQRFGVNQIFLCRKRSG